MITNKTLDAITAQVEQRAEQLARPLSDEEAWSIIMQHIDPIQGHRILWDLMRHSIVCGTEYMEEYYGRNSVRCGCPIPCMA